MNKLIVFLFSIVTLSIFIGCKDYSKVYKDQISQIDSLTVVIEDTQKSFSEIDTARIHRQIESINKNKAIYKNSNFTDTVTGLEFYAKLQDYESLIKSYSKLHKDRGYFNESLKYMNGRLDDLKHDVENNLLSDSIAQSKNMTKEELAEYYINQEKEDLNVVLNKIEKRIDRLNGSMKMYDSLNLEIENFVEDIKASQSIE